MGQTFAVFMLLNTVGSFYIAILAPGLWVCAIIDLCITVLAFSFARLLRMERILSATTAFIITQPQNQTVVIPIVTGYNPNQQFFAGPANQQQCQPTQPPPYQENQPKQYP